MKNLNSYYAGNLGHANIFAYNEPITIVSEQERPKTIVAKINQMFQFLNSLPKKDGINQNFENSNLYQQRDAVNQKKIYKETITPTTWSRLSLSDYKPTKRTVFSIALTLFFFQQRYTRISPSSTYCKENLNELLRYQGEILTDSNIFDGIINSCINKSIFDITDVNAILEDECKKNGINNARKYSLGIHRIDNEEDGRVTHVRKVPK
jgi:hypothetical protein